ncbi:MAG: 30S ribosomal protein S20 [Candidatus Omnitrophica bacterium]|nr:30S ribosomal protein S20 [Candidatus Omnitrophota bacterium]
MPILKSAAKRMRADRVRQQRNLRTASELKTLIKRVETALQARQAPQATEALRVLAKKLDIASRKGMLHRNAAARKKARLSRRLAQIAA